MLHSAEAADSITAADVVQPHAQVLSSTCPRPCSG